jgi:hypothetical protein
MAGARTLHPNASGVGRQRAAGADSAPTEVADQVEAGCRRRSGCSRPASAGREPLLDPPQPASASAPTARTRQVRLERLPGAMRIECSGYRQRRGESEPPVTRRSGQIGERRTRIELASSAWKAEALPLSYRRAARERSRRPANSSECKAPRGVAQSGSALGWGPSGRRFKSCLPDIREPAPRAGSRVHQPVGKRR